MADAKDIGGFPEAQVEEAMRTAIERVVPVIDAIFRKVSFPTPSVAFAFCMLYVALAKQLNVDLEGAKATLADFWELDVLKTEQSAEPLPGRGA